MDAGRALERLHADLGDDLRVFVAVHPDRVDVQYVRDDIDRALVGATTADGAHETHLRDVAAAMLTPDGTATIRYTPDAIVVGMPAPTHDGTGLLLSLEYRASDTVDEFVDTLLAQGATIVQATVSGSAEVADAEHSVQLND